MALNATALSAAQVQPYTDDAVLQYAKSVDVAKLDSTLSSQRLEDWLVRGPARIDELNWYVSRDCDLKDPEPDADGDLPLCVKVGFRRGNITGFGVLRVGTLKHGVSGQPAFRYLDVLRPSPAGTYDKLSDFPGYLDGIPQFQTPSDVTFCELARNPNAYSGKRIRIRAVYSYMFEVSRLKSPTCCSERGESIWVDFDDDLHGESKKLFRSFPKGMGVVLAVFIGKIETGKVYGTFGEQVRLVVGQIDKVEEKAKPSAGQSPTWVPQNCVGEIRQSPG